MLVNQNQVPATLSVTSLTYNNTTGLVTATASNALDAAGSIVHISGATPAQYDGAFVVVSATASTFTYSLATGLNLSAAARHDYGRPERRLGQPGDLHHERRGER